VKFEQFTIDALTFTYTTFTHNQHCTYHVRSRTSAIRTIYRLERLFSVWSGDDGNQQFLSPFPGPWIRDGVFISDGFLNDEGEVKSLIDPASSKIYLGDTFPFPFLYLPFSSFFFLFIYIRLSFLHTMRFWGLLSLVAGAVAVPLATRSVNNRVRGDAVVEAFRHSWDGYRTYAWGHDELLSVTNEGGDSRYVVCR